MALALSIKEGDSFGIGTMVVTITEIRKNRIKAIFEGPREIKVRRKIERPKKETKP